MGRGLDKAKTVDFSRHASSAALPAGARMVRSMTRRDHILSALDKLAQTYGFPFFTVSRVPARSTQKLSEAIVISNYPQDFLDLYDDSNFLPSSPVFERLRRSTVPFCRDIRLEGTLGPIDADCPVVRLARLYRMECSTYIPVHDIHGTCGVIVFSGNRGVVDEIEMKEMTFLSAQIFDRLSEVMSLPSKNAGLLSRRELECLNWVAKGKTTAEIAQILTLSDYTVNHYLGRATRKLDSVNRVQTVAKAIRAGLIG